MIGAHRTDIRTNGIRIKVAQTFLPGIQKLRAAASETQQMMCKRNGDHDPPRCAGNYQEMNGIT
jgi:hypothetical protein